MAASPHEVRQPSAPIGRAVSSSGPSDRAGLGTSTIVFDGDQTLWDFRSAMHAALVATRAELCRSVVSVSVVSVSDDDVPSVAEMAATRDEVAERRQGDRLESVRRAGFEAVLGALAVDDDVLLDRLCDVYFEHRHALVRSFPDSDACLTRLAEDGHRLALLTNGNSDVTRIGLAHHFDSRFHADDLGHRKPAPEVYATVAARLGGDGPFVSVGDSLVNDVAGPQAAGWLGIWLNRDHEPLPRGLHPDAVITDLAELPSVVDELRG